MVQVLMRTATECQLDFVKTNWMVRVDAPPKLTSEAKLINMLCNCGNITPSDLVVDSLDRKKGFVMKLSNKDKRVMLFPCWPQTQLSTVFLLFSLFWSKKWLNISTSIHFGLVNIPKIYLVI